jgi:hypothetical protein
MAVNVVQSTLSSRRLSKWLPWIAAVILAAGIIAFLIAYFGNTADTSATKDQFSSGKPVTPQVVRQVPLARGARETVGTFLLTAVARRHLERAWPLVTENIKGGLTFKQWMSGDIPVVPLNAPIAKAAITKIVYSHPRDAEINVVLVPKTPNRYGIKPTLYVIDVVKRGEGAKARWLVDYAQVQAAPGEPTPTN